MSTERHWVTRYDPEYGSPFQEQCECGIGHDHGWQDRPEEQA